MPRSSTDAWYLRLPDARVVHANSTRAVRHHLEMGTIPRNSRARRSARERWTPLYRLEPFADLFPEATRNRRESPERKDDSDEAMRAMDTQWQLHSVGVAALVT